MLIFDGIIFSLQLHGGIRSYYKELLQRRESMRMPSEVIGNSRLAGRRVERATLFAHRATRYVDVVVPKDALLFHSSYYRLPARRDLKIVTTVHDFTYEYFLHGPRQWLHSWQKFRAIRASHAVICVSENTRRDLLRLLPDVPPDRIEVVPNGVSPVFRPLALLAPENTYALFIGRRDHYKNFALAAEAVARVPGLMLWAVGGGPFTRPESAFLQRLLPGRSQHCGVVDDETLNRLYNHAHALLYPSSYEGFGIPLLEAMAAGCPVVALDASSLGEVAGDAGLLIPRPQSDLFAAALTELFHPGLRDTLRERGFARSRQFSWDRTFRETVAVYEKLLGHTLCNPSASGA